MSQYNKVALMIRGQVIGLRLLNIFAVIALMSSTAFAVDVAQVGEALDAGTKAGEMSPAAIWATVAIVSFACMIGLGWCVFTIGTKLQTTMATMAADLATIKENRAHGAEAMNALLNTARTELERTGILLRGGGQ